ncbi:MAG: 4-alpha-glucanotransferase [Succinivibrionaceae bacterium]|nr:4-alpha-glucanotransferase [Succinivibrionaceae bacterium]
MTSLVEQLAERKQISSDYIDAEGKKQIISAENKAAVLEAMGYAVDDEKKLAAQIEEEDKEYWQSVLDPVLVVKENNDIVLKARLPEKSAESKLSYTVALENSVVKEGTISAAGFSKSDEKKIGKTNYVLKNLILRVPDIPMGYHRVTLEVDGKKSNTLRLIVVPKQCYKPEKIAQGGKVWGPSVQLYTLRSERNWGVGDFGDLKDLIIRLGSWGAGFVGLNPIHELFPANPESASPYSPSTRRWINVVYINVEQTPEYEACQEAKQLVDSPEFQKRLADLRATEYVNYTGVMQAKLEVLKKIYENARLHKDTKSARGKAFRAFCEAGGDSLNQIAVYDALQASYYAQGKNAWGWPAEDWEEKYRKYQNPEVAQWAKDHEDDVYFYKYLQFLADEQMEAANQAAKAADMAVGIYRDLAVGVSSGSAEIWANSEIYCPGASIGCPPDPLGPNGQNWGLPPMDPNKLFKQQYQPIIDLFRSNMKSCGSLRIDHAMSLYRLWWVPNKNGNSDAAKGAYLLYRVEDMIGILALESHRNKCMIIGEDLGTVPEIMKKLLPESGIYSYKIFFFETSKKDGGYISTKDYPVQAMSALTTHDMATLKGFWHCDDLKLGRKIGVYKTDEIMNNLMDDRLKSKQKILDSLGGHNILPDSVNRNALYCGMTTDLNHAMQLHMCNGSCALFSTQLEDWIEMEKPVNIPGTSSEYPNWRRKLSKNISEIFGDEKLHSLATRMTEARNAAAERMRQK